MKFYFTHTSNHHPTFNILFFSIPLSTATSDTTRDSLRVTFLLISTCFYILTWLAIYTIIHTPCRWRYYDFPTFVSFISFFLYGNNDDRHEKSWDFFRFMLKLFLFFSLLMIFVKVGNRKFSYSVIFCNWSQFVSWMNGQRDKWM